MQMVSDEIKRDVVVRAPRKRVWQALTDSRQFSEWFGVKLSDPFAPGARIRGPVTHPGYEHLTFDIVVDEMVPEEKFSWRWHPHAIDAAHDYSAEQTTRVVFRLEDVPEGTRLTVVESGFDQIPPERRLTAYRGNEGGWTYQVGSIARYVTGG